MGMVVMPKMVIRLDPFGIPIMLILYHQNSMGLYIMTCIMAICRNNGRKNIPHISGQYWLSQVIWNCFSGVFCCWWYGYAGAPASFPVQEDNRILQKYLEWSVKIEGEADKFIKKNLAPGAFIGIHLRNGIDWVRACEHIPKSPSLFAAPQCVGKHVFNKYQKAHVTVLMALPLNVICLSVRIIQICSCDTVPMNKTSVEFFMIPNGTFCPLNDLEIQPDYIRSVWELQMFSYFNISKFIRKNSFNLISPK